VCSRFRCQILNEEGFPRIYPSLSPDLPLARGEHGRRGAPTPDSFAKSHQTLCQKSPDSLPKVKVAKSQFALQGRRRRGAHPHLGKFKFSIKILQRKLLHTSFIITSKTELCINRSDFRCQILQEKMVSPDVPLSPRCGTCSKIMSVFTPL